MSHDLDTLARTLYGEARGESVEGKVGVANVILNRFRIAKDLKEKKGAKNFSHIYGNGIDVAGTCLRAWQFSCWNENDPNREKILAVKATDVHFAECITIAKAALAGVFIDNTKGSTHYHVTSMGFPGGWKQKFEDEPDPAVIIGKHSFYNSVK